MMPIMISVVMIGRLMKIAEAFMNKPSGAVATSRGAPPRHLTCLGVPAAASAAGEVGPGARGCWLAIHVVPRDESGGGAGGDTRRDAPLSRCAIDHFPFANGVIDHRAAA